MREIRTGNTRRVRYPVVHSLSGYATSHMPEMLCDEEEAPPARAMSIRDLYALWGGLFLPSLWLAWWAFQR
jgi:hypothetical protein